MPKTLVIVESPTKAKTISKFLKNGFTVESSFGHVRDLPKKEMGVDIEGGTFEPKYVIPKDKSKQVKKLKELAKKNEEVIFATDEDREGEAISWHLAYILGIKPEEAKRMVFHEITKHAVEEALANPRPLDQKLVDAQQARRVLDRLVGYELSPLLWKKVARGLSAGRVQSVAVRLIVEREREIEAFKPEEYWTLEGIFREQGSPNPDKAGTGQAGSKNQTIQAKLHSIDGKKLIKLALKNKNQVDEILKDLKEVEYVISKIEKKETKRNPLPPFTTSTLQQQANHKLGYSSKQTMRLAQQLYEGVELGTEGSAGLITYMRTDSLNMSSKFVSEAIGFVKKEYGDKYSLGQPRFYKSKAKGAQEAHEAIRPTDPTRTPESVKNFLTPQQFRLYSLIWKRAVATQMAAARLNKTAIDVVNQQPPLNPPLIKGGKENESGHNYMFRATGQTMLFDGWLKLYPESIKEEMLPELKEGEEVECKELKPEQHFTEPPARYSDATLVKALEEYGIGRPSTYAPTISTIEARKYVERDDNKRLKPTEIAFIVNELLVKHFGDIIDYNFTALMEKNLDEIAEGKKDWQPVIADFYTPFHENIVKKTEELSKKELTEEKTDEVCEKCGSPMVIKMGRFGKFMACSNYPQCKNTKPIGEEAELEQKLSDEKCDKCGAPLAVKRGRYGPFLGCSNYPECKNIKKIEKGTGVKCNLCGEGEFVERKSKKGRKFYSCNKYPECKNALWSKPTGDLCPECKSPLVFGAKKIVRCSNKDCKKPKT